MAGGFAVLVGQGQEMIIFPLKGHIDNVVQSSTLTIEWRWREDVASLKGTRNGGV